MPKTTLKQSEALFLGQNSNIHLGRKRHTPRGEVDIEGVHVRRICVSLEEGQVLVCTHMCTTDPSVSSSECGGSLSCSLTR